MAVSKAEQAAYKQDKMPDGLDILEQLEYHCLYSIYNNFFKNMYSKEEAGKYKQAMVAEINKIKENYKFDIKCWETAGERYIKLCGAVADYYKNKSLENADKIVEAYNSLPKCNEFVEIV